MNKTGFGINLFIKIFLANIFLGKICIVRVQEASVDLAFILRAPHPRHLNYVIGVKNCTPGRAGVCFGAIWVTSINDNNKINQLDIQILPISSP